MHALGARLNRPGERKTTKKRFAELGSMSGPFLEPRRSSGRYYLAVPVAVAKKYHMRRI